MAVTDPQVGAIPTLNHERRGQGEPLVLVHGIGSQWQMWAPVLDALAQERDVVAVDLPGFGASPPLPAGHEPSPAALAGAVAGHLDSLGLDAPHVAGSSLGGWVALELARHGRARSVTALSPAGFWNHRERLYSRALLRIQHDAAAALEPVMPAILASRPGRTWALGFATGRPWRVPPDEALHNVRALATAPGWEATLPALTGGYFESGEGIDCPVTIAWGERDLLLLPRQARRAKRLIPHAKVITLEGCGHVPTWDDPGQVTRVLLEASSS